MTLLKTILTEVAGMFVDDGALALLSLGLIAVIGLLVKFAGLNGFTGAVLLFAGCIIILTESIARAARRKLRAIRAQETR